PEKQKVIKTKPCGQTIGLVFNSLTNRQKTRSTAANITYTQAGVSCFVGQESSKFKVQFFVGKFSGVNPCLRIAENRWQQAKINIYEKNSIWNHHIIDYFLQ